MKPLFMVSAAACGAVEKASGHTARRISNWVVVAVRQPHPVAATKFGWSPTTAAKGGILDNCRRSGAGAFLFQTVRRHGGHGGHSHGLGQGKNDKGLEPEKDEEDGDGQDKVGQSAAISTVPSFPYCTILSFMRCMYVCMYE